MASTATHPRWWSTAVPALLLAGAAGYVLLPSSLLALAAAGLYLVGAVANPFLALQVVVFSAPFYIVEKQVASLPFSPTEFVLLGAVMGWVLRLAWDWRAGGERPAVRLDVPDWPVLLFVVGALGATLAAENLATHARGLRTLVVEPLLFYWLLRSQVRDEERLFRLLGALALSGAVVGVHAIYQYLFTTETILAEGIDRARGFYGSPNNLGLFLGRVLPVALCLALWGGERRRLYLVSLFPVAVALALTFSIGAWIGVAAALLLIALASGRYRLAGALVITLSLVFVASWALDVERVTSHFDPEGSTWRWRGYVWQAGIGMIRDHPVLGVGIDNFFGLYEHYRAPEAWPEPNLSHPHNLMLDFWLNVGLAGLVGAVWLLARMWYRAMALWRLHKWTAIGAAGLGLAAATVDTVVHGLFDNSYFLIDLALVFWLGQGLLEAQHKSARSVMIDARRVIS